MGGGGGRGTDPKTHNHGSTIDPHSEHMGQHFQTEMMAEIYSESSVRAIGKVLLMKFS